MPGERWLDDLARDLARAPSRRNVLRRLGVLALGTVATLMLPPEVGARACSRGKVDCGGTCANLKTDERHCGECSNACPAGARCRKGECRCRKGRTVCGDACVDLGQDERHCGACGDACPPGQRCDGGRCVGDCAPGTEACGGDCCTEGLTCCPGARSDRTRPGISPRCVDLRTDPAHCGACGWACPTGRACLDGYCTGCSGAADCGAGQGCCRAPDGLASICCPGDRVCCATPVEARCCPGGYRCCAGTRGGVNCCPRDRECCGGDSCCGPGTSCCGGEGNPPAVCCPDGATCCPHGTLSGRYACCPPGRSCCPGKSESGCCAAGEVCCAGRCCPPGQACAGGRCSLLAP